MVLAYSSGNSSLDHEAIKDMVLTNGAFLFALVKNAGWITFSFEDQLFKVTKNDLQAWYGKELYSFKSKEDMEKLVQMSLRDREKVNEFFNEQNKTKLSLK